MSTPSDEKVQDAVDAGHRTAIDARALRKKLRRRTQRSSKRRTGQLEAMLFEIDDRMKPIRRFIGMIPYHDIPPQLEYELRATSSALQAHRRALKRMLPPTE